MSKLLNGIFLIYFLTHIPITVLFDSQVILSNDNPIYPDIIREILRNYSKSFKDPMVLDPPYWFWSFCICELLFQFPFFFVAVYAFLKGNCRWIRVPAIVYSSHVATTVLPIFVHIMYHDFSTGKLPGPSTQTERLTLLAIYAPYLAVPLLLLLTMLFSSEYRSATVTGDKARKTYTSREETVIGSKKRA